MYKCGCQIGLTKWSQVSTCNIFKTSSHKCPWCTCTGLPCVLVGSDRKALRDVPVLDVLPDGTFVTLLTVAVLHVSWRRMDRCYSASDAHKLKFTIMKASMAFAWLLVYSFVMG